MRKLIDHLLGRKQFKERREKCAEEWIWI